MVLPVARQASAHVVIHEFDRYRGLCHVAMAGGAADAGLIMLRVLESHMGRGRELINPLPGNFDFLVRVVDHFLHFRFIAAEFSVAQHAFVHGRNARSGARIGANVAINAIQPHLDVFVVWKCDWLLGARRRHGHGKQHAQLHPPQSMRLTRPSSDCD